MPRISEMWVQRFGRDVDIEPGGFGGVDVADAGVRADEGAASIEEDGADVWDWWGHGRRIPKISAEAWSEG